MLSESAMALAALAAAFLNLRRLCHPTPLLGAMLVASCGMTVAPAHAQSWAEHWFDNVTYTRSGSFEDQTRGYVTAGGMSGRIDVHSDYLTSLTLPKVKAGCGGIDMFLGGMSFLDPDYLVQKLESILQAAPAVAFQYLLETLDEKMGNIISKMEAATNFLNSIQVNDCRLANRMVQIAKGDDNMSGIIEEMTGYKSVKEGYAKSYQQSREKIQANGNSPTEDLKDALANCPAELTDIFRTGSLLAHAASRVGASDWAGVMRARVGDVYMRWDATDKVPLFAAIPACAAQDTESSDDFLSGRVMRRALAMPPTAADCTQDGGKGALALTRERMTAIAEKIRTRAALSAEERQFVANVRTLPVYRMLEWGVRQDVVDSVIGDTDELVALTLAYQMLNDLSRSIDFALSNAERGTNAAGASDGASANICQTRILTKGIEQLRDLREEVLRQRAQMRLSYLAALSQANLSTGYAGLIRQRDRDARDAAGAAATRNR
jgi:conjugative transfer pilus assembly protein TraH